MHGFTLRLPDDYRCHGPDVAGLSFFAFCIEHSDGGTDPDEAIQTAMSSDGAPEDERHRPFWEAARSSHPRLHRMTDILGDSFAVILLSQAELNGPLCRPPDTRVARALSSHAAPRWLEVGSGRALFDGQLGTAFDRKVEDLSLYKMFGTVPEVIASGLRETGVGDNFSVVRLSTGVYQLNFPPSIAPPDLNSGGSNGCPVLIATALTELVTAVPQPNTCAYIAGIGFSEDVDTIDSSETATNGAFNFIALPNH